MSSEMTDHYDEALKLIATDEEELGLQPVSSSRRGPSAAAVASAAILMGLAAMATILMSSAGASQRFADLAGIQGLDEEKPAPVRSLPFPVKTCTADGGCMEETMGLTMDANWRWYHDGAKSCDDCAKTDCSNCTPQEHVDYAGAYGVSVVGDAVTLTKSSRLYVLDASGEEYYMFKLLGKEFSFDVDVSALRCGVNSALYTVEMPKDGGYATGASIGTGYCDAQCPRGMKTIGGRPDTNNTPQCCNEMDLWEANRRSAVFTAHPCRQPDGGDMVGTFVCEGDACTSSSPDGVCDGIGCDVNPYRNGLLNFYDRHDSNVSSAKPITVTTQFIAVNGTLTEVRRKYFQDGVEYAIPTVTFGGKELNNSLTDEYCAAEAQNFSGDPATSFISKHGGVAMQGRSLARGNVLVISLWSDAASHMLWLDGTMNDAANPGDVRGPCDEEDNSHGFHGASVTFSNFRIGDIGATAAAAEKGRAAFCIVLAAAAALLVTRQ